MTTPSRYATSDARALRYVTLRHSRYATSQPQRNVTACFATSHAQPPRYATVITDVTAAALRHTCYTRYATAAMLPVQYPADIFATSAHAYARHVTRNTHSRIHSSRHVRHAHTQTF